MFNEIVPLENKIRMATQQVLTADRTIHWKEFDFEVPLDLKINILWLHINRLITQARFTAGLDENAQGKILMWVFAGNVPDWRGKRLGEIDAWSDAAWTTYYALKADLLAGKDVTLPEALAACPRTFAELLFE